MQGRQATPGPRYGTHDRRQRRELGIVSRRERAPARHETPELSQLRKSQRALDVVGPPVELRLHELVVPGVGNAIAVEGVRDVREGFGIARQAVIAREG